MGLPIQLVAAVNSNDIIHRTVKDGDFSLSGRVKATLASAMDIQVDNELEQMEDNELAYLGIFFFPCTLLYLVYKTVILPLVVPLSDALGGVSHTEHLCCRLLS